VTHLYILPHTNSRFTLRVSTPKNETEVLDASAIEKYFKDLYTSSSSATQEQYDSFIQELRLSKLSDEERDELEGLLTYDECKQILEIFPNDKSPGEDGFTVEF